MRSCRNPGAGLPPVDRQVVESAPSRPRVLRGLQGLLRGEGVSTRPRLAQAARMLALANPQWRDTFADALPGQYELLRVRDDFPMRPDDYFFGTQHRTPPRPRPHTPTQRGTRQQDTSRQGLVAAPRDHSPLAASHLGHARRPSRPRSPLDLRPDRPHLRSIHAAGLPAEPAPPPDPQRAPSDLGADALR
jgi:hypothetical protein